MRSILFCLAMAVIILDASGCATFHASASVGWSDVGVTTKQITETDSNNDGVEA